MMHVIDYKESGELSINNNFIPDVELKNIGDTYTYTIEHVYNLIDLKTYTDTIHNILESRTVKRYIRVSRDNDKWSEWVELENGKDIPCLEFKISPKKIHYIQLKWERTGTKSEGVLKIDKFNIEGIWNRLLYTNDSLIKIKSGQTVYLKQEEVYKVFSIDDYELVARHIDNTRDVEIEYRFSQDSGRTWTKFEPLTVENLSTAKITPIRFFQIEYKITRVGSNVDGTINIYGINLIGEFQNVSRDYFKTNLLGIREYCDSCKKVKLGKNCTCDDSINVNLELNDCALPEGYGDPMTDEQKENLFKPYELGKAVDFYNKVANDTNEVFGHEVTYFLTAPDTNGIDRTFHEYQLYNTICEEDIKVSVNENQFPDNQITFNQFDLSLFETFEIHITKDTFKQAFGVDKRPSKEDFLFFCKLNRMFKVEHAQPYKDFNNSSVFYKVILKKYSKKASSREDTSTLEDRVKELTKNSTLDELMGLEKAEDKKNVANKDETATLTTDKIRHTFKASVERELIENSSMVINKYKYNLADVEYGKDAIIYKKSDSLVKVSDNRAYTAWFKTNNYAENENYNFIHNYNTDESLGYKINLFDSKFTFDINDASYSMDIDNIVDDVWYCYVVNVNQRQREIEHFLYKRNIEDNEQHKAGRLHTADLKLVKQFKQKIDIHSFEFDKNSTDTDMSIKASDMSITNIRIFNEILDSDNHNVILNQNYIRDTKHIILADNSNKKVDLPNVGDYN